jgi:hypothetical protein
MAPLDLTFELPLLSSGRARGCGWSTRRRRASRMRNAWETCSCLELSQGAGAFFSVFGRFFGLRWAHLVNSCSVFPLRKVPLSMLRSLGKWLTHSYVERKWRCQFFLSQIQIRWRPHFFPLEQHRF